MVYLSSFKLCEDKMNNPNIYPHNVFRDKDLYPFMLGTLNAKIYNIDTYDYRECEWIELENVRYFYNFFKKHEREFTEE